MTILLLIITTIVTVVSAAITNNPAKSDTFKPPDNYLIDCGSSAQTTLPDRRTFASDSASSQYLQYKGKETAVDDPNANVPLAIYKSAKVFDSDATYSFHVTKPGWHWVRLHFYPVKSNEFKLNERKFTVIANEKVVLLHEYSPKGLEIREYLMNVTMERLNIKFSGLAFVNAIEVVSAPDMLIEDVSDALFPVGKKVEGMSRNSFQRMYRLNVGGAVIGPGNDTLGRTWDSDQKFLKNKEAAKSIGVAPTVVKYLEGGSPLIAPQTVYASAVEMGSSNTIVPNFNITWQFDLDGSYPYLIRLHFCDIVSKSMNELYFNVYVGGKIAINALDLSTVTSGLSVAYYKDVFVDVSMVSNPFLVQVGPLNEPSGTKNAILNGLEILRINNSVNSLDGEYGADGRSAGPSRGTVAAVGFAMMFGAFAGLGAMAVKWQKRPQDWQKKNSFSSWLLPLHAGDASFMSSSKTSLGSKKSAFYSSTMGLGRYLSFAELQEATKNWDPNSVIGVGGFGNVYLGVIEDGTKVAVKRGNPQSEQGINEFQTELQMLSKLRHRHLVSLIGPAIDPALPREQVNLAEWAMQWKRKGLLDKIIDPTLVGQINPESMNKYAEAAEKCLSEYGVDRPTMGDVLWNLEYALQLQDQGRTDEGSNESGLGSALANGAPLAPAVDNRPVTTSAQSSQNPAEVQVIEEHSGTAMFANLNSRYLSHSLQSISHNLRFSGYNNNNSMDVQDWMRAQYNMYFSSKICENETPSAVKSDFFTDMSMYVEKRMNMHYNTNSTHTMWGNYRTTAVKSEFSAAMV
ncbi:malectin/receptor-like protein kinase family protein [Artemisia annua]|uniref:Malectin/receptor-like protein kinase family protein n=1 Tax=Artemisia annua TaxID=35608 RepID=A0A2U1LWR5_ARTAN|nr:malectin/receptor-like protein kinase family protein [Artemisia annua]